eukprot:TRINITY_DN82036_c0_g1_i1.p1 TRINITY_DN82036_c0_g1~~TRINITY_DN82036_c0_g1_i1.p1  ORF type:complete len:258 (-),score=46.87 TRINITY_DN82036_c0_g1_i1:247-1020(-)
MKATLLVVLLCCVLACLATAVSMDASIFEDLMFENEFENEVDDELEGELEDSSMGEAVEGASDADEVSSAVIPFAYPGPWRQCDPKWGKDRMAARTICQSGCLMTSIATSLQAHGVQFRNKGSSKLIDPTPGTFNKWLKEHRGYTSSSALIHSAVNGVCASATPLQCNARYAADGSRYRKNLSQATFQKFIKQYRTMVANVHGGRHWVLAIGYDSSNPDRIYVRDSAGTNGKAYYSLKKDIVAWRIYDISGPDTPKK